MKTNIILKRFGIWLMLLFMPLIVTAAHSYVDLGLPSGTLWADCNVGASTSEGYGNFYAWGETKTKSTYSWSNYQYASGSSSSVQDIGTNIAGTKYDAAMAAWGGDWAMPTMEQANELVKICSISLATLNNVKGLRFKGPNGNTIFFPMTGYKYDSTYSAEGTQTYLWTDTKDIVTQMPEKAIAIYIERSSTKAKVKTTAAYRRSGMVIRAVRAKGEVTPSSADTDPQMVDLGLSVKWCSQNVNATNESEYGAFYAWGETVPKTSYTWANYQHANGSAATVWDIGGNIAGTEYDVAFKSKVYDPDAKKPIAVSLPTTAQYEELLSLCTWKEAMVEGHKGYRVTGPNGKSIFLPLAGCSYEGKEYCRDVSCNYWTSEVNASDAQRANVLYIKTATSPKMSVAQRRTGAAVRAVEWVENSSHGTELVDLGLSVRWCNQNLGAETPGQWGDFYAWGETTSKNTYTWANYQHANGSAATVKDIGSNIAGTEYDVAFKYKVYDSDTGNQMTVCLPTMAQYEELLTKCTWRETVVEGHKGYRVTGPNGKSIFLPLAGCSYEGKEYCRDVSCNYWTSEVNASDAQRANVLYIKTATSPKMSVAQRRTGAAVRAVEWMEDSSHDTELVDLGLSVRWCNQNLGAETPGQRGDFYAWGETTPKNTYTWANYQHANGSATTVSNIGSNISGTEYDVAFKYKGYDSDTGNQMTVCLPTMAQYEELLTKCTWKETVVEGHKGYNVTGPSGKSIFFPLAGCSFDGNEYSQEISCNYWTSEVNASDASKANVLYIKTATTPKMSVAQRRTGAIVRPVEKVDVVTTAIPYVVLNGTTLTFYYDGMRDSRMGTAYDLNSGSSAPKWLPSASNVKTVVFDSSFKDARPNSCCQWFHGMSALATITGIAHLNTSEVTNMQEMFTYCSNLSSLDLSHFNTANVTDMSAMFFFCTNLESLDLNNFDTKKVEHMGLMFAFSGLKELDLSNFVIPDSTMSKGKATFNMLGACQSLTRLVVPATAVNMCKNSCELVGTNRQPCHITAPVGFNFGVNTSGDYFKWKGGCFRFTSSGGSANSQAFDTDGVRGVMTPIPVKNNDVIYTLQGVKVEGELKPGIYIRNGRKFIVR